MANQEKAKEESRISSFFKGVKTEFRKLIWPDKFTLGKQLAAVVSITVAVGVIIALVDYVSRIVINLVIGL
ncbi:MAG: preprotein translocase subunit SecE [Lachnospiraceae bacterium]|nr:preprotein translocase subunit SecE [Lachnospiraceae bacterium]